MLHSLASDDDVAEVVNLYEEFFNSPSPLDSVPLHEQTAATDVKFGEYLDGADLGIEIESSMSPETKLWLQILVSRQLDSHFCSTLTAIKQVLAHEILSKSMSTSPKTRQMIQRRSHFLCTGTNSPAYMLLCV